MDVPALNTVRESGSTYRRLLPFLRPHWWRMASNIVCNMIGAALGAFSFTLLVPFLNALFNKSDLLPKDSGWITKVQAATVGLLLNPKDPQGSLAADIVVIVIVVAIKNVFVWLAGQSAASL